ncbi:hypothetical protein BJ508DRAFT_417934 [Ascobolus immersus RN42]|uniref:Uncharacterized protein n=1 Tax=Ascobolus immersus RN42 TaxID=1160509 RepID=A0A3N4HPU1_ASCIM|nr:hypothetical protein BJ508DRAFT_417934 [Ascobolus immersus RN42]
MKFTLAASIAALVSVVAAVQTCPADTHRICCYNLDERGTGYYCGLPQRDGDYPCGDEKLIPLCCKTSGNYPRGYVGNDCVKGTRVEFVTSTTTVCPEATAVPEDC